MKNTLVRSFIIHARSYRETSMIYDVLTSNCGLISILAKALRKKGSNLSTTNKRTHAFLYRLRLSDINFIRTSTR